MTGMRIMNWLSGLMSKLLPAPPSIGPDEAVVFVDVRTRREYEGGHVRGARNIPHDQMASRWQELDPHRGERLLLYCRSGRRSRMATEILRRHGFDRAENAGGFSALRRAGHPVDQGSVENHG
jgi:rhodanese-related sulfurtransferase